MLTKPLSVLSGLQSKTVSANRMVMQGAGWKPEMWGNSDAAAALTPSHAKADQGPNAFSKSSKEEDSRIRR